MTEMSRLLDGMVCVVTGGSQGIGKALALGLAKAGAKLVVLGRREAPLEAVTEMIARDGGAAAWYSVDVTDADRVAEVFASIGEREGHIDVLINNAGTTIVKPTVDLEEGEWTSVVRTNVTGAFLCAKAAGKVMLRQGSGSIINVASMSAFVGQPNRAAYGSSKAAVVQLTRNLAVEWGPSGIRVNCLAPGYTHSPLLDDLLDRRIIDPGKIIGRTPLRRIADADDHVGPALFLASDMSRFVTGQTLLVDGGWVANGYFE